MALSRRRLALVASLSIAWAACGTDDAPLATTPAGGADGGPHGDAAAVGQDAGNVTQDAAPNTDANTNVDANVITKGPPPSILPVTYSRNDVGTPLSAAELTAATDELIAIMKDTRYFDFVDERVHGWPESDPNGGYWWGTFWSGITVTKSGGLVTYKHSNDGADNAGIHTSPYLEGACWAQLMWGDAKTAKLVRRMARGFSAWIMAMERTAGDTNPRILSRTFYPPSVVSNDSGRTVSIDYSASRPGIDASPSEYVHIPANPTFGDIYVKNKRSKDDIGHMLRAITQVQACAPRLDAAGKAELQQLMELYSAWAADVDGRNFVIPTRNKNGDVYEPSDQLAHYVTLANAECPGVLAIRLFHDAAPGNIDCGSGISSGEKLALTLLKNDARQIMRTHHAAASLLAHTKNQSAIDLTLLQGLAERVEIDIGFAESSSPPNGFNPQDVSSFLIYAASVGVPLTSREVRWLHGRLHDAYVGMRDAAQAPTFHVFDAATPDGTYSFDPPNIGLFYSYLGMMIGSCASPYRNPAGRPLLDCARLETAFSP